MIEFRLFRRSQHQPHPAAIKEREIDRKSTRLNSSHSQISYAVFCLKKKRLAHVVTAIADLRQRLPVSVLDHRIVRAAMIDADGAVIGKESAILQVSGVANGCRVCRT